MTFAAVSLYNVDYLIRMVRNWVTIEENLYSDIFFCWFNLRLNELINFFAFCWLGTCKVFYSHQGPTINGRWCRAADHAPSIVCLEVMNLSVKLHKIPYWNVKKYIINFSLFLSLEPVSIGGDWGTKNFFLNFIFKKINFYGLP